MSDNDKYDVEQVYLESAAYNLLILKVPINDINDKLTYLSREKGLIAKSLYDDFLIATCVANINPFLQHLNQKGTDLPKLNEIRAEIIKKTLKINKKLDPKNLVLNKNHVIKLKKGKINSKEEILLIENEFWNKDIYKESEENEKVGSKLDKSKIKNIKDLKYITTEKFWKRIQQYVIVKQFNEEDVDSLLNERSFETRSSFEQYVITICIDEIEDLFHKLDKLGLPQRVDPLKLMHELYELCKLSNPFLDFDLYKASLTDYEENDNLDPFALFHRTAEAGSEENALSKKKKTKLFRHIKKSLLLDLGNKIKKRVIGQDEAIHDLIDAIQRSSVGLKEPEQPIGSFVFTGYTGCGKTYTAKILAEELIGDTKSIVTIDCSEYTADHEYAKLIGAPSGYIGHEQGGYLTNAVKKNPFSVVLFDEIEKASEKVHQLLLQIMEEARLTDGKGHHVSFRDTIIIMTSNIGVEEVENISKTIGFGNVGEITTKKQGGAIKEALKNKFKPEFLNRITSIINFNSLTKENYLNIIKLELDKLRKNLKLNNTSYSNLKLKFDKSLYSFIYDKGVDKRFGARPLKRAIERKISTPLARKLLNEDVNEYSKINIYIKDDELKMDIEKDSEIVNPPFYMMVGSENK